MGAILCQLVGLYTLLVFVRIILSWFPVTPGGFMESAVGFLDALTAPLLDPLRRALPPARLGNVALDLSPLVLLLVLQLLVQPFVCSL